MQCIICEKPSQAKNYANALGGFKGKYNGKEYEIVNSVGHIFGFKDMKEQVEPSLVEKYTSWEVSNLPWNLSDIKFNKELKDGYKKAYDTIKECVGRADEIVIATDDDPTGEGTLLADEILLAIKPKGKHYFRSFHTDESIKEIRKAMDNLTDLGTNPLNDPDYKKADFRSKWDFMSIQWTRIFTKLGDGKSMLRQGRLKSYMVYRIGEQIALASAYKKIPYYENRFKDENGNVFSNKDEEKYEKREDVPNKYHASEVIVDSKEKKYGLPPLLYDLNMLSATLAQMGFKAKNVLDTYQRMYEDRNSKGEPIVSYPRTEDKTITVEQFYELLDIVPKLCDVVGVDKSLIKRTKPRSTHVKNEGSHGANRPGGNVPKSLDEIEKKYGKIGVNIYKCVAKNALAMFCDDYEYMHETGHLKDYPNFKAQTNIPIAPGYKAVFNDTKKKEEEENTKELGKKAEPFVYEGFPPKPAWPTAKWLAKELKKANVGTGATRTSILASCEEGKCPLITDTKGKLDLTEYGKMSYFLLGDTHIGALDLTEGLYKQMEEVAKGADPNKFLNDVSLLIVEDIQTVKKNAQKGTFESVRPKAHACPVCGAELRRGKFGIYCPNMTDKKAHYSIPKEWAGKKLTDSQLLSLVEKGETEYIRFKSKNGKTYQAKLRHDNVSNKLEMVFKNKC